MANSVDPDQTALIGAVCSGSRLYAYILNSSVMKGNFLQQTTFSDTIFGALRVRGCVCAYVINTKMSCAGTYLVYTMC